MSLTATAVIDGGRRIWELGSGLKMAQLDITSSDVSADYSSGFDIAGSASTLGFRKVFGVVSATIRTSAHAVRGLLPVWDANTGKLRLYENASAIGAFDEADADTDFEDGDIIRALVIGV